MKSPEYRKRAGLSLTKRKAVFPGGQYGLSFSFWEFLRLYRHISLKARHRKARIFRIEPITPITVDVILSEV
jgi:hypothetical protein